MKKIALILFITLLPFLFLLSPRAPEKMQAKYGMYNVKLNDALGFSFNADSSTFLSLAADLNNIITKENFYQNRPLMILVVKGISLPFVILAKTGISNILPYPFRWFGEKNITRIFDNVPAVDYYNRVNDYLKSSNKYFDAYYFGFLFFNIILLYSTVFLFIKFIDNRTLTFAVPLSALLVMNDGTKALFFTPHTQIFNTLNPIIFAWISFLIIKKTKLLTDHPYIFSLATGLIFLIYGSFSILIPLYFISLFLSGKKLNKLTWLKQISLSLLIFFAPALSWLCFIKLSGGTYYNWEVTHWHQFVWIIEAARGGILNLIKEASWKSMLFFDATFRALSPYSSVILLFIFLTYKTKQSFAEFFQENKEKIQAIFISTILIFVFFLAMGYYNYRFSLNFAPLLLILFGLFCKQLENGPDKKTVLKYQILINAFTLFWVIFQIVKAGPYS